MTVHQGDNLEMMGGMEALRLGGDRPRQFTGERSAAMLPRARVPDGCLEAAEQHVDQLNKLSVDMPVRAGLMLPRIAAYPADRMEIQDRYMRGTLPVAVPCSALGEFQATKEAGPIDLVICVVEDR